MNGSPSRAGIRAWRPGPVMLTAVAVVAGGAFGASWLLGGPGLDPATDHLADIVPVPAPEAGGSARLVKGPMVQAVGGNGATLVWETDGPAASVVELSGPGMEARRLTGHAFRVDYVPALDAIEPSGVVHHLKIDGLLPGERYNYRLVGVTGSAGPASTGGSFVTAPARTASFRMVVFGDNRGSPARFAEVLTRVHAAGPSVVLATGDVVGDGGSEPDWQSFFDVAGALLRDIPLMSALGNHDVYGFGLPRFEAYFPPPDTVGPAYDTVDRTRPDGRVVYGFDWGAAHFVVLNSNHGFDTAEAQAAWLRNDVAAARARGARVVMAFFHHPLFTLADHKPRRDLRAAWWEALKGAGVDAVFAGHNHVYERFVIDGIQVITTGGGGAPSYDANAALERPEAALRVASASKMHLIVLDVSPDGRTVAIVADGSTGATLDSFVLE